MQDRNSIAIQIDEICDRFDAARRIDPDVRIADFWRQLSEEISNLEDQHRLLMDLILIDLEFRLKEGDKGVATADYLSDFPELTGVDGEIPQRLLVEEQALLASLNPLQGETVDAPPTKASRTEHVESLASKIDDYEIVSEIARGGMGIVYKAWDKHLKCHVALKTIRSGEFADQEEIERFHREAEAAANLQHPGIVGVHRFGESHGLNYFTMDYIDGSSLAKLVGEQPLEIETAVQFAIQICEAVEFAHQHGILHRDLKPANVLVDHESGLALVSDFGLAKRVNETSDFSQSGQAIGTPSYMPPEQAAGRKDEINYQSDVYSIGALLYHLLTGRPPFVGKAHHEVLSQVIDQNPTHPAKINPLVKRDLNTVCLKCLEKEPSKRYASAAELRDDLRRFSQGFPIHARPAGLPERGWRWCRRNSLVASLSLTICIVMVVGASFGLIQRTRRGDNLDASLRSAAERLDAEISRAEIIDESAHEALIPGRIRLDAQSLNQALQNYKDILRDWKAFFFYREEVGDDVRRRKLATAFYRVAQTTRLLGDFEHSEVNFRHAIEEFDSLRNNSVNDLYITVMLGKSWGYLGELYREYGSLNDADEKAESAYLSSLSVLTNCIDEFPLYGEAKLELARTENNYGILLQQSCREKETERRYASAESTLRKLVESHPDNLDYRRDYARTLINVGVYRRNDEQHDDAELVYNKAIDEFRYLLDQRPKDTRYKFLLAITQMNLGYLHESSENAVLAENLYLEAQEGLRKLPYGKIPEYRFTLAKCLVNLAVVYGNRDELDRSSQHLADAEEELLVLIGKYPDVSEIESWMGRLHGTIAWIADLSRDYDRFVNHLEMAIAHQQNAADNSRHTCGYEQRLQGHHRFFGLQVLDHYLDQGSESRKAIAAHQIASAIAYGYRADFKDPRFDPIREAPDFREAIRQIEQ